MAKPRIAIGTFGTIMLRTSGAGRVEARTRYRDFDGVLREVYATGKSRAAAERALKGKLAARSMLQPQFTTLTADSRFAALVDYWLEDLQLEGHLAISTRDRRRLHRGRSLRAVMRTHRSGSGVRHGLRNR